MKTRTLIVFLVFVLCDASVVSAQGFTPPAEGKAVIYFARVTKYGYAETFEFFHNDRYIGAFKNVNYMRYECDPGNHLFWASSENKEFLTADLKEGGTYIVIVNVIIGGWKGHVGFSPITADDERFVRARDLIMSKPPVDNPESKISERNTKLAAFIGEQLKKYNEVWKNEREFRTITADMFIPDESLK